MEEIEVYSKKQKDTADELLKNTGVVGVLSEFGEVIVGGSYKYDLMWGPDIDIVVKCGDPRKASMDALQGLVKLGLFQKYEYGDFVNFGRPDRPKSYIVNLRLPYAGQRWEIETWFFEEVPESQIETDELIRTKLNAENKITILKMKKERDNGGNTKHQLSSADIYRKVLVDGVATYEGLLG